MRESWDGTLGIRYTIEPTLRFHGFLLKWEYRDEELTPREQALRMIPEEATECVYHVWSHSRGYCEHLNLFYKK